MNRIHGNGDGVVELQCDNCDYGITRKDNLRSHYMTKHSGIKFQCDLSYSNERNLKRHLLSIHFDDHASGEVNVKVQCGQCEMMYSSHDELKVHINKNHEGDMFKCCVSNME